MTDDQWRIRFEELRRLLQEQPESGEAWFDYARFLERECDNPSQAVRAYEKAQSLLPEQDLRLHLGLSYMLAGEVDKGIDILQSHVREKPTAHGNCLLGDALMKTDRPDEARKALEAAIHLDPDFDEAYFLMGELLRNMSKEDAIRYYRLAIEKDPNYQLAWQRLGSLLSHERNTLREAIMSLRRAIALNPEDAWAYLYLGNTLWKAGRTEEADWAYRRAITLVPEDSFFKKCYEDFQRSQEA